MSEEIYRICKIVLWLLTLVVVAIMFSKSRYHQSRFIVAGDGWSAIDTETNTLIRLYSEEPIVRPLYPVDSVDNETPLNNSY